MSPREALRAENGRYRTVILKGLKWKSGTMEAALEKALANPGLGLLVLDDTNQGLAEDVEQLRQEVSRVEDVWKLESEARTRNTEYVSDMTQMMENIQVIDHLSFLVLTGKIYHDHLSNEYITVII